ncbi:MAG: hypothetical protein DRJ42_23180 [Deltaproteobacteria bacterium]|nr:MAG: hypothetical protein DRJ42_23180 [Deltaproteobacteria bacterium]
MVVGIVAGLLAVATFFFAVGGSGDAMSVVAGANIEDVIDDVVEDDERRERVEAVIEDANDLRGAVDERYDDVLGQFVELAESRESEPADFESLVGTFELESQMERVLDLRFRLKAELTEEEWGTLYGDLEMPE